MERKMSVAEFASLVGATPKTIYERIKNNDKLPVNEQLIIVKERVNGRETSVISTNSEQVEFYQSIYGKSPVIYSEYYKDVTVNNEEKTVNENILSVNSSKNIENSESFVDKLIRVNEEYNNRIEQKNSELLTVQKELLLAKQTQLLLEDKASREGLYLNEITQLKQENNSKNTVIKWLISVIVVMLLLSFSVITYFVTVNYLVNNSKEAQLTDFIEKVIEEENLQ
jgi:hypothetical protein